MPEIKESTIEKVTSNLLSNFMRVKRKYDNIQKEIKIKTDNCHNIEKNLVALHDESDRLEDELQSMQETYDQFCQEAGISFKVQWMRY